MVNLEDEFFLKQGSFPQVVETLLASIDKQQAMLNYLLLIEKKKLVQLDKNSASCLDSKRISQSVGDILEKIKLYQTLVTTKLNVASTLPHEQNNSSHLCCNHCSDACDVKNHSGYWGRH